MARVKGNVLGNLSGKLGNLSARTRNGETTLSARPSSFNASQDPEVVANRQKFAVTANFSKYVLSIPTLKDIWEITKANNLSVSNAIFKANYPYSSADRPTDDNILTPDGFTLPVTSAEIDAGNVAVVLSAMNTATIIEANEVDVSFASIIVLYNPISPEDAPFKIIKLFQDAAAFDFANPYTLTMALHASENAEVAKYSNSILLLAAATKDADSNVIQYSNTFSQVS
ncbi:MAG: hypothetical protein R3250_07855 [Melioribacteraceae bacterium]|nr:hypothetical protein [Melioribacteraceae bacterium]